MSHKYIVCILISLFLLVGANDVNRRRIYNNLLEKNEIRKELLNTNVEAEPQYFLQTLDHFVPEVSQTFFNQLYYVNTSFWKPGGPAFLIIGGESALRNTSVTNGAVVDLAQEYGAILFAIEHRFYGTSNPFNFLDDNSLPYLTTQQALSDLVNFQSSMLSLYNISQTTKWAVFGCSYSGAVSAWFKLKFPNLAIASFAGSSPVEAVLSFYQYDQVISNSLGSTCAAAIHNATLQIQDLLLANQTSNTEIRQRLKCETVTDSVAVLYAIADAIAYVVQYNVNFQQVCSNFTSSNNLVDTYVDFMDMFYGLTKSSCESLDISSFTNSTYDPNDMMRQWMWQSCDELGYFQTAPAENSLRSTLITAEWHITNVCKKLFGNITNGPKISWTNSFYGGNNSLITSNTIFTNGLLDPWQALSVTSDLSSSVPSILVANTAHCENWHSPSNNDPQSLINARIQVSSYLGAFLNSCGGCGINGMCTYKRKENEVISKCVCLEGWSGDQCSNPSPSPSPSKGTSKRVEWWWLLVAGGGGVIVALALGLFIGRRVASSSRKYETI